LAANDPRILVGLGNVAHVDAIQVRWPDGSFEKWKAPSLDRYVTLTQSTSAR
jgi:hypothetical protein